MMRKILFICHGNICRSPMAEFILKHLASRRGLSDRLLVESAAVSDEEHGNPIYPPAARCLRRHDIPFDPFRTARRVSPGDYRDFDLIVCMDRSNLRWLERIVGNDTEHKVRLMMSYAGKERDVADPWYTGDFETTFNDLAEGCEAMINTLGL